MALFDIVFLLWALVIPFGLSHRILNNDGDLPRHLRLGEWMLQHHGLITTDQFSFTMQGRPFVAFEWLSEVVYAAVYRVGGLAGVTVLAGLVIGLTYALLVRLLLNRGVEPLLAYLTAMLSAMLGALHWVARPHLFTMLLVVVLLDLLERREKVPALWLFPLFVLWANLHGGFSYGLVLVALYLVGEIFEYLWGAEGEAAPWRIWGYALGLVLGTAGAFVTPHGWQLFRYVFGFFGHSLLLDQTQEFMSPDFHVLAGKLFLSVILAIMAGFALSARRPSATHLLVLLANLYFSLISARNVELFALTALPLMAIHFDSDWRRLGWLPRMRAAFAQEAKIAYRGMPSLVAVPLLLALAVAQGRFGPFQVVSDSFDPRQFPVAAVERAREAGLDGRLYSEFTWNGYILHAWPEQKVYIDPGTDHYGEALSAEQIRLWNLRPGWDEVVRKWGFTTMVLPVRSALAYELRRDGGWDTWYCDATAVVLVRDSAAAGSTPASQGKDPCTRSS